jgi:hypothetical protein
VPRVRAWVVCDVFVGEGVDLLAVEGVAEVLSEKQVPCLDCYSFEYYIHRIPVRSAK